MANDPRPQLLARFKATPEGKPEFIKDDDLRHYKIVFEVENAPPDTYAATLVLDPTYYDNRRTLRPDSDGRFRLETTTFGDYNVTVRLRTKEGDIQLIENLEQALERARERSSTGARMDDAAVNEALAYIAAH